MKLRMMIQMLAVAVLVTPLLADGSSEAPLDPVEIVKQALLLRISSRLDEALRVLRHGTVAHPSSCLLLFHLAEAENQGDKAAAAEV